MYLFCSGDKNAKLWSIKQIDVHGYLQITSPVLATTAAMVMLSASIYYTTVMERENAHLEMMSPSVKYHAPHSVNAMASITCVAMLVLLVFHI